ncbi:MAG TPA: zinc-ribbon domain-containing protein [Pyrinomonadaceae bacterium]
MPEPEIDRRCNVCGAAVRPRAGFCPQCGQPVSQNKAADTQVELGETQAIVNTSDPVPFVREPVRDLSETQPLIAAPVTVAEQPVKPKPQTVSAKAGDGKVPTGRVGKLRKASSVVLDQAAYDPSLRFILVAAGFFLLFLLLLFMSKVLG